MSILINNQTRIIVQGITGKEGLFHAEKMLNYGSKIVAGATPGKGGEWVLQGKVPVFDCVSTAVDVTGADTSVIFVPPLQAADAIIEAADAGIRLIICITEGVPVKDMMIVKSYLRTTKARLIGPNSPGILSPGQSKAGIIPGDVAIPGNIGVLSRSGTLTYEVIYALKNRGLGISTCIGIGGDPIIGSSFIDVLSMFESDPETESIILIGEIGGMEEENAAKFISVNVTKPVFAYIAGESAPLDKRMGHAGAIIERGVGTAKEKIAVLRNVGIQVAHHPEEFSDLILNQKI